MSFDGYRNPKGERFSKFAFDWLKEVGFSVALNGTEHTKPEFVNLLKHSTDTTSRIIRYQPDGVIAIGDNPRSAYVEAKCSRTIEKDAYKTYMDYSMIGGLVYLIFGDEVNKSWHDEKGSLIISMETTYNMRFCDVTTLQFDPPNRFDIEDWCWPIIDDWICPREHPRWPECKWKHDNGTQRDFKFHGSGTPFRRISYSSLHPIEEFKSSVIGAMVLDMELSNGI